MYKPYVAGMDIGGTNSVFGIVDSEGNILATDSIKTKQYETLDTYVDAVCQRLLPLIDRVGGIDMIQGFGIGAPCANHITGLVENAANLPWGHGLVPLAKAFSDPLGIPVALTNDANAAAIGEMKYGAARGMTDFIEITLGTGVGSGIVIGGQLVYGHDGYAGELGHVIVEKGGRPCGCGRCGCLETYCSATGVARTAAELLAESDEPSLLRNITGRPIESKDVYDAAVKGDKIALDIFDFTGRILGQALADFTAFSTPEAFILFGGLAKSGDYIVKPIKKYMEESMLHLWKGKVKVLTSQLKDADAALLGASAIGWDA